MSWRSTDELSGRKTDNTTRHGALHVCRRHNRVHKQLSVSGLSRQLQHSSHTIIAQLQCSLSPTNPLLLRKPT